MPGAQKKSICLQASQKSRIQPCWFQTMIASFSTFTWPERAACFFPFPSNIFLLTVPSQFKPFAAWSIAANRAVYVQLNLLHLSLRACQITFFLSRVKLHMEQGFHHCTLPDWLAKPLAGQDMSRWGRFTWHQRHLWRFIMSLRLQKQILLTFQQCFDSLQAFFHQVVLRRSL